MSGRARRLALAGVVATVVLGCAWWLSGTRQPSHLAGFETAESAERRERAPGERRAGAPSPGRAVAALAPAPELGGTDACRGVLTRFAELVVRTRREHDAQGVAREQGLEEAATWRDGRSGDASTARVGAPIVDGADLIAELFASDATPSAVETEFGRLRRCADTTGESEALRAALLATYAEESRPELERVWLGLLSFYDLCDPMILSAVRGRLDAAFALRDGVSRVGVASGESPTHRASDELLATYRSTLLLCARCPDVDPPVLVDVLRFAERIDDRSDLVAFYATLAAVFPWSAQMAAIAGELVEDPQTRWAGVELLWVALETGRASVDEVRAVLEARPELIAQTLEGAGGPVTELPFGLLVARCGDWGAEQLRDRIDAGAPNGGTLLALLGMSNAPAVSTATLEAYLESDDPEQVAGAWLALGYRARSDDAAFERLLRAVESVDDPAGQTAALDALARSGRATAASAIEERVLGGAASPEVKVAALSSYAGLPGADRGLVADIACRDVDVDVRRAALYQYARVAEEPEQIARLFARRMADDDDLSLRYEAAALADLYYTRVSTDERAREEWAGLAKPPGYSLASALGRVDVIGRLRELGGPEFDVQVDAAQALARFGGDAPSARRYEADAFALSLLHALVEASAEPSAEPADE